MSTMKELRLSAGLTQPQLASFCRNADKRIDVGMISRFECGACLPTPAVAKAISIALNCTVEDLYGIPEQMYIQGILASDAPVEPESMEVLDLITNLSDEGKPIRRAELADRMGMSDRKLRQIIEDARNAGYIIINNGKGDGYYLAATVEDIYTHFRTEEARAMSILRRLKKSREILKQERRI